MKVHTAGAIILTTWILTMLVMLTGCATPVYGPTEDTVPEMSDIEARGILKAMTGLYILVGGGFFTSSSGEITSVVANADNVEFDYKVRDLVLRDSIRKHTVRYQDVVDVCTLGETGLIHFSDRTKIYTKGSHQAIAIAQALYAIGHNLCRTSKGIATAVPCSIKADPAAEAAFPEVARKYREATVKPGLSEEAHKYLVQAEFAVEKKNLSAAIDRYADALDIAPWWPDGHLKRGQLLADIEQYTAAIAEMKKVLLLASDGPEARVAQDNIYKWESAGAMGASKGITAAASGSGGAAACAGQLSGQYAFVHHVMAIPYTTHKNVSFTIHADGTVSGSMAGSPLTGRSDSNGYLTAATGTDPDFVFTGQISKSGNALSATGNYRIITKAHFLIPAGEMRSGDWSATGTTSSETLR